MKKFQFHIIGRADDISNIETADIRKSEKFPDMCAQTKVSWSKNVQEERDCPDQILIGANDPEFCVLLALACYLECRFVDVQLHGPDRRNLFAKRDDDDEPTRINEQYRKTLEKL